MRRSALVFLCILSLSTTAWPDETKKDAPQVATLIERLGSASFEDRETATKALEEVGTSALPALRIAASSNDPEVRQRATRLVRLLERQSESARLLAPQRVRLICKDTPLADAVADLAKQAGIPIKLEGDKLAGRRITLDTGEANFWYALDQLCHRAGLVECGPAPPAPKPATGISIQTQVIIINGNQTIISSDGRDLYESQPKQLILGDGKPLALPTHYAGAVRLRALPRGDSQTKRDGETLVNLEVSPEPRVRWQRIVNLRIDRALDD